MLLDLDGHEAQHVFGEAHLALHLVERGRRAVQVHQRVVGLAVLLDAVGEGLQSPVLDPADGAAVSCDDALVLFDKRIDLLLRHILPGKEHMFVKCHCSLPFFTSLPGTRRLSLCNLS